ncbi:phosphatidylinositol-specific phospholipase C/glycerophosphodiester phosphodiesterase family protein [Nocardioides sp. NPDC057772]|uniref:phosphatidylinositol-specific phospholipase C/glycerophosphodiester phosphodiesterase family protein n=1 Tax=Nocardioides sp. NPDC057772 TaxID=3346245 RepID=UPI003670730C
MRTFVRSLTAALVAAAFLSPAAATASTTDSTRTAVELGTPHAQAHAHNDYEHERPLFDALEHGFTSVEADVWLVDGELLVAHDAVDLDPARTLEGLYLAPLKELVKGKGRDVYPGYDGTFQLLIDIKNTGEATYAAIEKELAAYEELFTRYENGVVKDGPVEAVISGDRPLETMRSATRRLGFYDGRMGDLRSGMPASLMPLVSDNWTRVFVWQGVGPMPEAERRKLHEIVDHAHAQGYRVRFWATPDADGPAREAVWTELLAAGVDHINTDDLEDLDAFLTDRA